MEQGDARATMGLQDTLEMLPQELHRKMLPANRTFVLRRTSKTMYAAVENAKQDTVVVRKSGVKFRNGAGLQDKFNGLNAWCRVTVLDLSNCALREGGGQAIAAVLRENHTLTNLNLADNWLRRHNGCENDRSDSRRGAGGAAAGGVSRQSWLQQIDHKWHHYG